MTRLPEHVAETAAARPRVVASDARAPRRAVVARAVAECGADFLWIDTRAALEHVDRQSAAVAVVGLDGEAASSDPGLNVIQALAARGLAVAAYGDGTERWPLGRRARSLLAGASALLDSGAPPFPDALREWVRGALRAHAEKRAEDDAARERMRGLGLVGGSAATLALFQWIVRVAALSDLPTLVTGETGTGKELVARAIHRLDLKRQRGPFVALNCGALSPALAESELFGHRRGAFTGAERDRKGLFRSAAGGVLFLDEIGEMDAALQIKLLRVLQDGRLLGVGDDSEVAVDVRVIAATNRDLPAMVRAGAFREDLFHRLNVVAVHLRPLHERREDVGPLVDYFVEKYRGLNPAACGPVGADFVEALGAVDLPGNARQLENLVRWAVANKRDASAFALPDLPADVWRQLSGRPEDVAPLSTAVPGDPAAQYLAGVLTSQGWSLARSLAHCERVMLQEALRAAAGNQSRMARMLEITPRAVYNKLRKYRLQV